MIRIRLHGTPADCRLVAERLAEVFTITSVSAPRADRATSALVRVYIRADLPAVRVTGAQRDAAEAIESRASGPVPEAVRKIAAMGGEPG